ncbi:MAG: DMT family transporter [Granulosicoccus sp.]|nr:DMT family transporter [Granulosicoccus sp.]
MSGNTHSTGWGIACMSAGMLIVPVMDAIAKHLGQQISPMQITWGRFLFQFLIMGIAIVLILNPSALLPKHPLIHTVRGLLLAIATTFFFFSLRYLPLADAIAIFFIQPILLTLLSALFLGEHIGWHRRVAVVTGFAGALLIIQPGAEAFTPAALLPLSAAVFYATYIVLTRSVANVDHPLTMQFASSVGATLILSLALLFAGAINQEDFAPSLPNLNQWMWLFAIGAVAAVGHLLVVVALNRASASLLAPFGYMEIVSATALGWFIFNEWPTLMSWAGITVIIASGLYVFVRERAVSSPSTIAQQP